MKTSSTIVALALGLQLTACMQSSRQPVTIQPTQPGTPGNQNRDAANDGAQQQPRLGADEQGAFLPIVLQESDMQKYGLDTANLSFSFTYLDYRAANPITFANQQATINLTGLPNGRAGEAKLEILQNGVIMLRGVASNVLLNKGQKNTLKMQLQAVSPDLADLTVDLVISGNGGGSTPPSNPPPSNPPPSNPPPSNPPPSNPPPSNPPPSNPPPSNPPPSNPPPGSSNGVTFSKDVKPIMDAACTECHTRNGPKPDLSSASTSAAAVDRVIGRIANGTMPPAPRDKVSSSQLETIRKWKAGGLAP